MDVTDSVISLLQSPGTVLRVCQPVEEGGGRGTQTTYRLSDSSPHSRETSHSTPDHPVSRAGRQDLRGVAPPRPAPVSAPAGRPHIRRSASRDRPRRRLCVHRVATGGSDPGRRDNGGPGRRPTVRGAPLPVRGASSQRGAGRSAVSPDRSARPPAGRRPIRCQKMNILRLTMRARDGEGGGEGG